MEELFEWMRNLIACLCILELLYHMVRNSDYQKYLRFFGGLIFMLMALQPVLDMVKMGDLFERAFQNAFFREEVRELQETVDAFGELRNAKIEKEYIAELERQIVHVANWYGQEVKEETVILEEENVWPKEIRNIEIVCRKNDTNQEIMENIQTEIAGMYGLRKEQILLTMEE